MQMGPNSLLLACLLLNALVLVIVVVILMRRGSPAGTQDSLHRLDGIDRSITTHFTHLTAQAEKNKGELRQELSDRLADGLNAVRQSVETQLTTGRGEQNTALAAATQQLEAKFDSLRGMTDSRLQLFGEKQAESLGKVSSTLDEKMERLSQRQMESAKEARQELSTSLESLRAEVDRKLNDITSHVQDKLDQNIKEGVAQFAKVQEHLKAAEEQLRNVGTLGNSIHDLNSLLKLPHLRGKFGEASLERLLADFLPAHMFSLQMGPEGSNTRADAMIHFPERNLPIDAKFPREQVLALFESDDTAEIEEARVAFARVMKEQARRVKTYIQPENGTTDIALMYLPSETLYMETVRNRELSDELNKLRVFPVSPNSLLVTLNAIAMVHRWYQVQKGLAKSIEEFGKAKRTLELFEAKFEVIGKSLDKAREAYDTANTHLSRYKSRITQLGGEEILELADGEEQQKSLGLGAS